MSWRSRGPTCLRFSEDDLHAGHVPHIEPGIWAKSPMTSPWLTGTMLSSRTLGRPPREPSESYELVLSTLSLTALVFGLMEA